MRLLLVAIQTMILALPAMAADPFSPAVAASVLARLRAGETVTASVRADGLLTQLPSIGSREEISADFTRGRLAVGVEILRILGGFPRPVDAPAGLLGLYNALHAVSTMKGITYWSVTHNEERVLFSQSFAVQSAKSATRIPDPVYSELPAADVLFTYQEDQTFGRNTYRESFGFRGDHVLARIENLSTISFALIPLVRPGNFVSWVVLAPAGADLLFYGASYIRTSFPIGDRRSREESLANRLLAMARWLESRLSAAASP